MTNFNEQFLGSRKDAGEKIYETNTFCCWGCKTSRNKIHQHFVSVRKIIPMIATVTQNNPWKKLSPYRLGNWDTWSSRDACEWVKLAVGGVRILTRSLSPTLDEDRQGFPSTSPRNLLSPLHLRGKFHLSVQFLLACSQKTGYQTKYSKNLSTYKKGWKHNDRRKARSPLPAVTGTVNKT